MIDNKRFAKVFGITESEVEQVAEAVREYSLIQDSKSYKDWLQLYDGIHHEGTFEQNLRNWLACMRWMKDKKAKYLKEITDMMPDGGTEGDY